MHQHRLNRNLLNLTWLKHATARSTAIALLSLLMTGSAIAGDLAFDMVGSADQNLISFTNPYDGAFTSAGDGFQKYQRGVSASIPFSIMDDSLVIFPGDNQGIIKNGNTDVFFGATDTVNDDTSGPVSATWVFDISGASNLGLSIDMGAMGDFETSDTVEWTYSIDGGPALPAFTVNVDELIDHTYTLEGGASFTLNDPALVSGVTLTNDLTTHSVLLAGTGAELTVTLTINTNGGTEAFAFQNLVVTDDNTPPPPGIAFDMVESTSLNLTSFTNPYDGAFGSAGDGFQKYQRGISASIPFSVLDDSLVIWPTDSLGIIKDGNTDEFFGATDTQNGDNNGPVSATWEFDVSGASGLGLSIDMGAMGDFESSDSFVWTYSIDGAATLTAFSSTVDEDASYTYTLEGGASFTLNDPMLMQGTVLTNDLATFSTSIAGEGSTLTVTLTAQMNGGTEAIAFQNLVVTDGNPPPELLELEIWEIQGSGASSPFNGNVVLTNDDVVTTLASDGFFMQSLEARSDGDINTSDGIFVYTGSAPAVAVGDLVDVNGEIQEFFGFTEISSTSVVVDGSGPVPAPVVFDATVPSPNPTSPSCAIEYECYEGMLVEITGGSVTGPNQRFSVDPVAEVHITAAPDRTFRETGIEFPGIAGLPEWDGNPEVFELDPDKLGLSNEPIPAGSHFDATGVIGFEFGGYELWPSSLTVTPATLPQAVRDAEVTEMTVGALNLFRLFDDIDDPDIPRIDPETGDEYGDATTDTVIETDEYMRRLTKFSGYIRTVLMSPDVLAVSEVESLKVLQDLADEIKADDDSLNYTPYLEEGNDIGGIDVGFLVLDTVEVDEVTQLGRWEILQVPGYDDSLLNDRPPLLLEGRQVADGSDFPIAVISIHGRSLGGIDGGEADRVQAKRLAQAQFVAQQVQDLQTANPDINLVVAGDFNAFEFTDSYVDVTGQMKGEVVPEDNLNSGPDLVDPNLLDQVLMIDAGERYSFIFRGNAQTLDHALTSTGLDELVRDYQYGRGNADAAVDLINDDSTVLRSSDHDGLVLFLAKDSDGDGVTDDADYCPGTVIPEAVPTRELRTNNFALVDDDRNFDTKKPKGKGPQVSFDIFDTAGCSCEQIIVEQELGNGHMKFGCSLGEMEEWVEWVNLP